MGFGIWFSLLYFKKCSVPKVLIFQASLGVQPEELVCQEEIERWRKLPENMGWRDLTCREGSLLFLCSIVQESH